MIMIVDLYDLIIKVFSIWSIDILMINVLYDLVNDLYDLIKSIWSDYWSIDILYTFVEYIMYFYGLY